MSAELPIRVMVHEVWDEIPMAVTPATTVREIKQRALAAARVVEPADAFLVKFRGAALADESRTVAESGFPAGAPLIVLRRLRRPVH
ncbi:MAG: hypothetical protein V9E87_12135 [Gemmatimonadales bacterium]